MNEQPKQAIRPNMDKLFWCSVCSSFSTELQEHNEHDILDFNHNHSESVAALDDVIDYGLRNLNKIEEHVEHAQTFKNEIDTTRQKCLKHYRAQIDKCVKMFRDALEDCGMDLLAEVNKSVHEMDVKAQSLLRKSKEAKENLTAVIQQAAIIIPDEEGNIDTMQLSTLFQYFVSVSEQMKEPQIKLNPVNINIKTPNSFEMKKECVDLARRLMGQLEVTEKTHDEKQLKRSKSIA